MAVGTSYIPKADNRGWILATDLDDYEKIYKTKVKQRYPMAQKYQVLEREREKTERNESKRI